MSGIVNPNLDFGAAVDREVAQMLAQAGPAFGLALEVDQTVVFTCIKNYANPDCTNAICWLVYRIWNCIKWVFGQSDWQVTQNLLHNRMVSAVSDRIPATTNENIQQLAEAVKDNILLLANEFGPAFMEALLKTYNVVKSIDPDKPADLIEATKAAMKIKQEFEARMVAGGAVFEAAVARKARELRIPLS